MKNNIYSIWNHILESGYTSHNRRIHQVYDDIQRTKNQQDHLSDDLTIKFDSERQLEKFLYNISMIDLLKIRYVNEDNELIRKFIESVSR